MPKLSDTMTEGTLVTWKKKKGDQVSAGEVLAEIETDKATMEWESPEDGTLTEIYVQEGGKVNIGDKIAFIEVRARKRQNKKPPNRKNKKSQSRQSKKLKNNRQRPKSPRLRKANKKKPRLRRSKV